MFPYWFIILFSIFSIVTSGDKVIPKQTEGITLLQSIAVFYWVFDYGFIDTNSVFLRILMAINPICDFWVFSKNTFDKFAFFIEVMQHDTIAPQVGTMTFEDYIIQKVNGQ